MADRFFVLLTTTEFAEAIGATRAQVYRLARSGAIPAVRRQGRYLIPTKPAKAAPVLGVSSQTVRRRISRGDLLGGIQREPKRKVRPGPPRKQAPTGRARPPADWVERIQHGYGIPPNEAEAWLEAHRPDLHREVVPSDPREQSRLPLDAVIMLADQGAPPMRDWAEISFDIGPSGAGSVIVNDKDGNTYVMEFPDDLGMLHSGWSFWNKAAFERYGIQIHKNIDSPGRRKREPEPKAKPKPKPKGKRKVRKPKPKVKKRSKGQKRRKQQRRGR